MKYWKSREKRQQDKTQGKLFKANKTQNPYRKKEKEHVGGGKIERFPVIFPGSRDGRHLSFAPIPNNFEGNSPNLYIDDVQIDETTFRCYKIHRIPEHFGIFKQHA